MNRLPRPVRDLINVFEKLPGIGPKSASRLTFYVFQTPRSFVDEFIRSLTALKEKLTLCPICYNIDETNPCQICQDRSREEEKLCVVEQPLDVVAIEQTNSFRGKYHVLGGVINPLLHIGPDDLHVAPLVRRVTVKGSLIKEIILATNPTMEGEATALHLKKVLIRANPHLKISRIGHGLPLGADLDYADPGTLAEALRGRQEF